MGLQLFKMVYDKIVVYCFYIVTFFYYWKSNLIKEGAYTTCSEYSTQWKEINGVLIAKVDSAA